MSYAIRIAILYSITWFIDLLDASILNVALPAIAQAFGIDATAAEWAIIGFLLALTIAIPLSGWLSDKYGAKKYFYSHSWCTPSVHLPVVSHLHCHN